MFDDIYDVITVFSRPIPRSHSSCAYFRPSCVCISLFGFAPVRKVHLPAIWHASRCMGPTKSYRRKKSWTIYALDRRYSSPFQMHGESFILLHFSICTQTARGAFHASDLRSIYTQSRKKHFPTTVQIESVRMDIGKEKLFRLSICSQCYHKFMFTTAGRGNKFHFHFKCDSDDFGLTITFFRGMEADSSAQYESCEKDEPERFNLIRSQ